MQKIALIGAGFIGCVAAIAYLGQKREIACFLDNNLEKQGKKLLDIPIVSMEEYINNYETTCDLIISCNSINTEQIKKQLQEQNISKYELFDLQKFCIPHTENRLLSYSQPGQMEDVILYHALLHDKELFYIDVGSNDPVKDSVTKLLYDMADAHGINIEPQIELCRLTQKERPRDISLNCGIGEKHSSMLLHVCGGFSTFETVNREYESRRIEVYTLAEVCSTYIKQGQKISFLKIDVEGFERQVLFGADLMKYRPLIIEIESVDAENNMPTYVQWEDYLIQQRYHFAYAWGVNRYYVADERRDLDQRFIGVGELSRKYQVYFMGHM